MQRHSTPPAGPRGRGSTRTALDGPRASHRGGIQKRRGGPVKTDKDGDLNMDAGAAGSGAARGRATRGRGDAPKHTNGEAGRGRTAMNTGAPRGLFSGAALQKAIARGMAAGDATVRGPRAGVSVEGALGEAAGRGRADAEITVRGLKESKAAANPDGGLKDLVAFLERKASGTESSARDAVKIKKSYQKNDRVIVYVTREDAPKILRLNTFTFAGAPLAIEMRHESAVAQTAKAVAPSEDAVATRQKLTDVLKRRYNPELKLLDLSALGKDPDLVGLGTFAKESTTSKFFPALMAICDSLFTDDQQKRDAVVSVSLADNELQTVKNVTTLAQTFPDLKNLDLSNNKFETMGALSPWRWKFRSLHHLVLSGNPIEKVDSKYKDDLLRWYPILQLLNTVQVRTEEEITSRGKLPLPVSGPSFRDEGQIAENFVKQFFPAYDSDRNALVSGFYDTDSVFSYNINTSAPRAPPQQGQGPNAGEEAKAPTWENYIKGSRNLMKINHLSARISRVHVGQESIRQRWTSLPATRHPSLLEEGRKWLIECHSVPALADPSGQSPAGVGGLMVMVHGEFDEMNVATGEKTATRSFDRTFILGPGGATGIRVLSDILTYRAYGGHEAWVPEEVEPPVAAAPAAQAAAPVPTAAQLQAPDGFGVALEGKPAEQLGREQMMLEMSSRTRMTLQYSQMCLEEKGWEFDAAFAAFEAVKTNLPPDAFVP
ncbi:MAG: nuclear mRNA export, poly(A)+RNA binding protein [Thelocarpon impressellum]|nr:MAG: nuclear mRNA export, poly(A)+RNA binding protein [Thelocarpon impressellum]